MFEFDKYETNLHSDEVLSPASVYQPCTDVERMSLLFWSEHCIECAAPSCFATCDLYQSRPDRRCRRFAFGMFRNTSFPSIRGYGAEIRFKKWAKLEARGNTALIPLPSVLRNERLLERSAPFFDLLGSVLSRCTSDIRWNYLNYRLQERLGRWLHGRHAELAPTGWLPG